MLASAHAPGVASGVGPFAPLADSTWDALVIGAGPAGAIAAFDLARRGLATLIIDRRRFPRAKVCGGCLNAEAVALLKGMGLQRVLRETPSVPLDRMYLASAGRSATIAIPGGCVVARDDFDHSLVRAAQEAGASLLDGAMARIGAVAGDSSVRHVDVVVDGRRIPLRASVVINAGGLGAVRWLSADQLSECVARKSHIGLGMVVNGDEKSFAAGAIWMAIGRRGYVGIVRQADNRLNVAAAFCPRWLKEQNSIDLAVSALLNDAGLPPLPTCDHAPWHGTLALSRRPARVAAPRVLLVGDAAGYVEPFTGEGMTWAIQSARAAAAIASQGISRWSPELENRWSAEFRTLIACRHRHCRWLTAGLRWPPAVMLGLAAVAAWPRIGAGIARRFTDPRRTAITPIAEGRAP